MFIGISGYSHESAVALVNKEGELIDYCKEESLSRIKGDKSFPKRSIKKLLVTNNLKIKDIERVALARAIANEPNILLLDEPFSSIDTEIKENLIRDIKNLLDHLSITTLMVTHDQYEAFSLADTIAVMNEGKFHQIGSPYDIYHEPLDRFVADFIGMGTFLPATVNSHGVETPLGTFPIFKKDIINLNNYVRLKILKKVYKSSNV